MGETRCRFTGLVSKAVVVRVVGPTAAERSGGLFSQLFWMGNQNMARRCRGRGRTFGAQLARLAAEEFAPLAAIAKTGCSRTSAAKESEGLLLTRGAFATRAERCDCALTSNWRRAPVTVLVALASRCTSSDSRQKTV